MDTKIFIEKLNDVFCKSSREGIKYSEVWLSDADFGGLYNSGKFTMHVKAEHEVFDCFNEIEKIVELLDKEATEESKNIYSVIVYDSDNNLHCSTDDILVFKEMATCR